MVDAFFTKGWARFPSDPEVLDWIEHARPAAIRAVHDPDMAHWHQCQGTWFVGVDALDNDDTGAIAASGPLAGAAIRFITDHLGPVPPLHRAQISVTYPGYPRPRQGESDSAFAYRRNRDAAHVDGVLAVGPDRRRMVQEPNAFVLGLPLTQASADAAPLVVWDGSHHIMKQAFTQALAPHDPADWSNIDVTDAYQAARRKVFETCPRIVVPAAPGAATLLHRFTLHGVASWADTATADPQGRMIAYFRPEMPGGVQAWITAD